jgi:catechol-2,3-dioxygenase
MANKGLCHIALRTRDLAGTEAFYTGVLGLEVAFRHPPGMIFLTTAGSHDLLNFIKSAKPASGNQALDHIGFKVTRAALARMEQKLKKNHVAIEGRRGKNAIYISDPNGYQIEFFCD